MYDFPHTGLITQELLGKQPEKHGYNQSKVTPGLWQHKWHTIAFSLVVDDFGFKCVRKEHANHLITALKQDYELDEDWNRTKYCGISLDLDYENREVHLSMSGYVEKGLQRFNHIPGKMNKDQPYQHIKPNYGTRAQYVEEEDS